MIGIRLVWLFVRLAVLHEMAYRTNFIVQVLVSTINLLASVALLATIFAHTPSLGDWRPSELIALLGVFYLLSGLLGTIVQPSLQRLMENVRLGTLDFVLVKPVDTQALVSVKQVEVWKLVDAGIGLALIVAALVQLEGQIDIGQTALFLVLLLAGGAVVYSCCLMLATLTFWFVRVESALIIFLSLWEAGRWPVGIYPSWLRATLTFVFPVAFATTVPAEALAGRLTMTTLIGALALAAVLVGVSRWLWCRGLSRYTGASA